MGDDRKQPNTKLRRARELRGWSQRYVAEQVGTAEQVVSRWESGQHKPNKYFQTELCKLFGMNAEELGFIPAHEQAPQSTPPEQLLIQTQKQTHGALIVPSQALQTVLPPSLEQSSHNLFVLTDSDVSDRLAKLLTKSSIPGMEEIIYFDQQTKFYWRTREETASSASTLYLSVIKYMDGLTMALARSHLPLVRQQLCETISKTALLAGMLLYDRGQYTKARKQFDIAFQASVEANNPVLQSISWARMSFTWTYSRQYQKALHCIQYARHLAAATSDILVQAWLAAVEAEIQAHLLDCDACIQCLNTSDYFMNPAPSSDIAYLFGFNQVLLLGYKGVCLQRFYQEQSPKTHDFLRDAKSALEVALVSKAPLKRNSTISLILQAPMRVRARWKRHAPM